MRKFHILNRTSFTSEVEESPEDIPTYSHETDSDVQDISEDSANENTSRLTEVNAGPAFKYLVIKKGIVKLSDSPSGGEFTFHRTDDGGEIKIANEEGEYLTYDSELGERVGITRKPEEASLWSISDQGFIFSRAESQKKYLWSVNDDVYMTQDTHVRDKWVIVECDKGKDVTYHTSTDKSFYIKIGLGLAVLVGLFILWKYVLKKKRS